MACRIAIVFVTRDVGRDFRFQSSCQHPPCAFASQSAQAYSLFTDDLVMDNLKHGWRLLRPGGNQGLLFRYAGGHAAFLMPSIHNFRLYLYG